LEGYAWYRFCLSKEEAEIYDALLRGMLKGSEEIRVCKCDVARLSSIFEQVRLDHPRLFFADGMRYRTVRGEPTLTVLPNYVFSSRAGREMTASLEKRMRRILAPMEDLSPGEAVEAIKRFLFSSVVYDKVRKQYSHEIIGVLHHGIGVCEGIAKTAKAMCDALDIPCIVAIGPGSLRENAERHAWNLIFLDGKWRHYDFTFDLSLAQRGSNACRYFGLTDAECFLSHGTPEYPLPSCIS
jgi:transglutaminase/protease-like cytokinesis protein 3